MLPILKLIIRNRLPDNFFKSKKGYIRMTYKTLHLDYYKKILAIQKDVNEQTEKLFMMWMKQNIRLDTTDSVDTLMLQALENYTVRLRTLENVATTTLSSVNKRNSQKYQHDVWRMLGVQVDLPNSFRNNWVKGNVSLITNINTKQVTQIERIMRQSAFTGKTQSILMDELQGIFKGTERNIALIARDQINKLGGALDQYKQTQAGVSGYYWRTSRDESVRSSHQELEGQYFTWDRPPEVGHPGEAIQCRCDAEPALDKLLGI